MLANKKDETYSMIVGLSLGSIISMFINPEVFAVYLSWNSFSIVIKDILIGAFLMIIGIVVTYLLVRYQRKKNEEKISTENSLS